MTYEEWEATVPECIRQDPVWKMKAYRLGLFLGDVSWHDVLKLISDRRTRGIADQLYRSAGSISADITEGYSRSTGADRARFYEYAAGSAREARDWYYKGRHVLGVKVASHRMELATEVVKLLLTMIPQQRRAGRQRVP